MKANNAKKKLFTRNAFVCFVILLMEKNSEFGSLFRVQNGWNISIDMCEYKQQKRIKAFCCEQKFYEKSFKIIVRKVLTKTGQILLKSAKKSLLDLSFIDQMIINSECLAKNLIIFFKFKIC